MVWGMDLTLSFSKVSQNSHNLKFGGSLKVFTRLNCKAKVYYSKGWRSKAAGKSCTWAESREAKHRLLHLSHTGYAFSLESNYRDIGGMSLPKIPCLIFRIWVFYGRPGHMGSISCYTANHGDLNSGPQQWNQVHAYHPDVCAKQSDKLGQHGPMLQVYTAKSSITDIKQNKTFWRPYFQGLAKGQSGSQFPWRQKGKSNQTCYFNSFLTKWLTKFPEHLYEKVYLCPSDLRSHFYHILKFFM